MAQSAAAQRSSYPLPVYNFRVTVKGETTAFSEASGLALEREKVTYRHGLSFTEGEQLATIMLPKWTPLTLRRGIVARDAVLYDWFSSADPRPIEIGLCDENGEALVQWKIASAVPTRLQAPSFNAAANEFAVETLELMISGLTVEHR